MKEQKLPISQLTPIDTITDDALIPIVKNGATCKITYSDFINVIAKSVSELTFRTDKNTANIDYIAMMTDVDIPIIASEEVETYVEE